MSFELEDGGDTQVVEQEASKATPPPVAPAQAPVDVTRLAGHIVSEVMRGLTQTAQQDMGNRATATQNWVQNMLNKGSSPEAIRDILALREAEKADEYQHVQRAATNQTVNQFNASIWENVNDAFAEFKDVIAGLEDSEQTILLKTHKKLMEDPEFADEQSKIARMVKPSKKAISLAMARVVDEKLKKEGRVRPAMPIDRASSKPSSTTTSADPIGNLNKAQSNYYNAFKKDLGHDVALREAKKL